MSISDILLEQVIEGALMASGQTLSVNRLHELFDEDNAPEKIRIEQAVGRLSEKCTHRGYELKKVATGYRFQVKQEVVGWVSRLWDEKPQRYSRALLETLSIIAYRQPVTRGEIEDIRGVAVSSHITKTLLEREWVQVVGHRDVPGRPAMFATTKMFLDYFNLESLDQLPTLEEIQEIADANHALELEDKVEEGGYDFTSKSTDESGEEALLSAAEDMAAAEAIVEQVESNVFKKNDDEDEPSVKKGSDLQAEVPDLIDSVDANTNTEKNLHSIAESFMAKPSEDGVGEDNIENESGQASAFSSELPSDGDNEADLAIARMIAEQEALLNSRSKSDQPVDNALHNELPNSAVLNEVDISEAEEKATKQLDTGVGGQDQATLDSDLAIARMLAEQEALLNSESEDIGEQESIIQNDTSSTDLEDEDALMAAIEEEAAAQLEREAEEQVTNESFSEVEKEKIDNLEASSNHDSSFSELAHKFNDSHTTEPVDE